MKKYNLKSFVEAFKTDEQCRNYLEKAIWNNKPVCPFCHNTNKIYKLQGEAHRQGVYKCSKCRKQFTITVGTIFERSHLSLPQWFLASFLVVHAKKGISSIELSKVLGITQKTSWFLIHRIRESMKEGNGILFLGIVEADETYVGGKTRLGKTGVASERKTPVLAIIERGNNKVRTKVLPIVNTNTLSNALQEQVNIELTKLMTDGLNAYKRIGKQFRLGHASVDHLLQYADGETHVNSCESYFSLLKRGIYGIFHSISKKHLSRYCDEFNFKWNNKREPVLNQIDLILQGIVGKRLMYREPKGLNKGLVLV